MFDQLHLVMKKSDDKWRWLSQPKNKMSAVMTVPKIGVQTRHLFHDVTTGLNVCPNAF
jgi:hypothetical protein